MLVETDEKDTRKAAPSSRRGRLLQPRPFFPQACLDTIDAQTYLRVEKPQNCQAEKIDFRADGPYDEEAGQSWNAHFNAARARLKTAGICK